MALVRYAFAPIALTAAGCLIALLLIPPIANAWMTRATRAHTAVHCHNQQWPNADRICLTWTAPREVDRDMDARTEGRRP